MKGMNIMTRQFTIVVKGNQFADSYARVATTYTKWSVTVTTNGTYIEKLTNVNFISGLDESDITPSLKKKTIEFRQLDRPCDEIPQWLL